MYWSCESSLGSDDDHTAPDALVDADHFFFYYYINSHVPDNIRIYIYTRIYMNVCLYIFSFLNSWFPCEKLCGKSHSNVGRRWKRRAKEGKSKIKINKICWFFENLHWWKSWVVGGWWLVVLLLDRLRNALWMLFTFPENGIDVWNVRSSASQRGKRLGCVSGYSRAVSIFRHTNLHSVQYKINRSWMESLSIDRSHRSHRWNGCIPRWTVVVWN